MKQEVVFKSKRNADIKTIFDFENQTLIIERAGAEKTFKIETSEVYTWKCLKTKMKAYNGAEGLYNFFNEEHFSCWIISSLEAIMGVKNG